MERIETFTHEKKQIVYFNLSKIQTNSELMHVIEQAKTIIKAFAPASLYTITNISHIIFDTETKEIAADWMAFNKPYVINAAVIGAVGTRKMMMCKVFALSGRTGTKCFNDMNQALAWITSV